MPNACDAAGMVTLVKCAAILKRMNSTMLVTLFPMVTLVKLEQL